MEKVFTHPKLENRESIQSRLLEKGWIETKERWVGPAELRAGIVIKDNQPFVPIEIVDDGKRKHRIVAQRYLESIGCGKTCHNEMWSPKEKEMELPAF